MTFKGPLHLKTILFLSLGLISFLPLLLFSLNQAVTWKNEQIKATVARAQFRADILGRNAAKVISVRRQALEALSQVLAEEKNLTSKAAFESVSRFRKNFSLNEVAVLNRAGHSILADPVIRPDGEPAIGIDYSDHTYFKNILKNIQSSQKTVISQAIISRLRGNVTIQIVVPIKDSRGKMRAVLSSGVYISEISEMANELVADDPQAQIIVIDKLFRVLTKAGGDFNSLSDTNNITETSETKLPKWDKAEELASLEQGQSLLLHDRDDLGREYYGAAVAVHYPDLDFYIVFTRPYSAIVAQASKVAFEAGLLIFLSIVISVFLSYFLATRLAGSVTELSQSMTAFQTDLPMPTAKQTSLQSKEITALAQAFRHMKRRLNRQTRDLELRVQQRTADLMRLNEELDVQRAKNQYAGKMAALGEMAAGVAHEINNPLAVIMGRVFLLKKQIRTGSVAPTDIEEAANDVERTVMRIAKTIQALRFFSRDGANDEMSSVSVAEILQDTIELCSRRFAEHNVDLQMKPIPESLYVECRGSQISQVILNLLSNSFDAVSDQPTKWVRIDIEVQNKQLIISVTDSGPGISQELREKIMQPFFTTKVVGKGTGLGLSISRGIIVGHGGSLDLDVQANHTRFVLKLPIEQQHFILQSG